MIMAIWTMVLILAFESLVFGNGFALVAGLALAMLGVILEWRKT